MLVELVLADFAHSFALQPLFSRTLRIQARTILRAISVLSCIALLSKLQLCTIHQSYKSPRYTKMDRKPLTFVVVHMCINCVERAAFVQYQVFPWLS